MFFLRTFLGYLFCFTVSARINPLKSCALMAFGSSQAFGWSTANWFKPPSNFIAGLFGSFRCGVWLCFVILVRIGKIDV